MHDHEFAVRCDLNIYLDHVDTDLNRMLDGCQCVLWSEAGARGAAVGDSHGGNHWSRDFKSSPELGQASSVSQRQGHQGGGG